MGGFLSFTLSSLSVMNIINTMIIMVTIFFIQPTLSRHSLTRNLWSSHRLHHVSPWLKIVHFHWSNQSWPWASRSRPGQSENHIFAKAGFRFRQAHHQSGHREKTNGLKFMVRSKKYWRRLERALCGPPSIPFWEISILWIDILSIADMAKSDFNGLLRWPWFCKSSTGETTWMMPPLCAATS